ncbi:sigma-70 family RNA polymerase sigma factor [Ferrovibrio sp.]|uniref:sigma-70 family RNA polymerase sigma factor n=1 Tax=Ferrovibrio sp. TaxID=1917215 RepID=UPI0025C1D952|nr:sigma-70 family RNA polymerase sigma factor [Ferrovibrio sp.]MBX3454673.1 sigma-70 family RNA polymerase sigma factor [Ferrovibrio sp.]
MRATDHDILGLFVSHQRELIGYARAIVGDQGLAEDIVQDAYIRIDRVGRGVAGGADRLDGPVAYLFRIVRNLAIDHRRRLGRENAHIVSDALADTAAIAEERPGPEATAIARNELRLLTDALAELPERSRIALEMYRFGGCRFSDIAEHLDVSVGTAHKLVVEALRHCRQRVYTGR